MNTPSQPMIAALITRAHCQVLQWRIAALAKQIDALIHYMALDLAVLFVLQAQGGTSKVLELRRREDEIELAKLEAKRASLTQALDRLGTHAHPAPQPASEAQP